MAFAQFSELKPVEAMQQTAHWRPVKAMNAATSQYEYCAVENDFTVAAGSVDEEKITLAVASRQGSASEQQTEQTNIAINFGKNRLQPQAAYRLVLWVDGETRYVLQATANTPTMLILPLPVEVKGDLLNSLYHGRQLLLQADFIENHALRFSLQQPQEIAQGLAVCRQKNNIVKEDPLRDVLLMAGIDNLQQLDGKSSSDGEISTQYLWNISDSFGNAAWENQKIAKLGNQDFRQQMAVYLEKTRKQCRGKITNIKTASNVPAIVQGNSFYYASADIGCSTPNGGNTATLLFLYHPQGFAVVFQESETPQGEQQAKLIRQKITAALSKK
ncbi:MAG: hypothetical protein ACOYK8_10790 [Alphaproteobacteria bacterium]